MNAQRTTLTALWQRLWLVLAVAITVIGLDQWTKWLIRRNLGFGESVRPVDALGDYFLFEHVVNHGAAFGILQGQRVFFIVIAIVVSAVILYYAGQSLPEGQRFTRFLLGLQMGGAIGNVTDRIHQGYVTDFVKIGIPEVYYWPNFNIADSAIVCGVIALAALLIWQDFRQQRQQPEQGPMVATGPSSTSDG